MSASCWSLLCGRDTHDREASAAGAHGKLDQSSAGWAMHVLYFCKISSFLLGVRTTAFSLIREVVRHCVFLRNGGKEILTYASHHI